MGSSSLLSRAHKHQVIGHNLSPVFLFCALPVFPTCSLEFSFDIKLRPFGYKLAHDLGKPAPDHNVVPFCAVLEFAALVLESFVRSQAESSNRNTACGDLHFRVVPDRAEENLFVYAFLRAVEL